jgi:RND family efflux transporter MFP subunit
MEPNSKRNKPGLADLKIDPKLRTYKKKNKPTVWIISGFFVLAAVSVLGMTLRNVPTEVETAVVRRHQAGQGLTVLNASGYVEPKQRATIAAKITGQVVEMLVEEGMKVEKGQILARIDGREANARLDSSKADLEVALARINELEVNLKDAERDLSRMSNLFSQEVASQENMDKAKAAVDRYKAQLSRLREEIRASKTRVNVAKRDLENCTIRAPFTGIVVSKDAQVGEMVSPISAGGGYTRTGIATIVDMDSLEIEVDVNESYIANVTVGQKVIATLDAYQEWKIPAKVRTLIPTADRQKATVKVRIAFDKLDPRILPDMGVKVAFMTEGTDSQSTAPISVVPKAAIRESDGKSMVFVLNKDSVERRAVKPGKVVGSTVEILAGLTDGEQVVVSGPLDLKDGQRVVVKK